MENLKPLSVLVVDDDPEIRTLLVDYLNEHGFETVESDNAVDAFALILETHFDVVITDIRMPRNNGIELLMKIKKYRPRTQVLLMSGNPELADSPEVQDLVVSVLEKPFAIRDVVEVITNACARVPHPARRAA